MEEVVGEVRDEHDPHEIADLEFTGHDAAGAVVYDADGGARSRPARPHRAARRAGTLRDAGGRRRRTARPHPARGGRRGTLRLAPGGDGGRRAPRGPSAAHRRPGAGRRRGGRWHTGAGRPGAPAARRGPRAGLPRRPGGRGGRPVIALQLFVAVLTLVANAFFVGGEFSLVAVRRSQIEPTADEGDRRARTVLWALENLSALMAPRNSASPPAPWCWARWQSPPSSTSWNPPSGPPPSRRAPSTSWRSCMALAVATYLHMLVGEMVPKNVALAEPVRTALALGPPLVALTRALSPWCWASTRSPTPACGCCGSNRATRSPPSSPTPSSPAWSPTPAGPACSTPVPRPGCARPWRWAAGRSARSRSPPEQVVRARLGITPEGLEHLAAESGFSRFPVTDADGRTLGYLHVKDALDATARDRPFETADLRPVTRVGAGLAARRHPDRDARPARPSRRGGRAGRADGGAGDDGGRAAGAGGKTARRDRRGAGAGERGRRAARPPPHRLGSRPPWRQTHPSRSPPAPAREAGSPPPDAR